MISPMRSGGGQGSGVREGKSMLRKSPCRSTDSIPLFVSKSIRFIA